MITYILDCKEIDTRTQMHGALAEKMAFPAWYGGNLDALHDMLTSLSQPRKLLLLGYDKQKLGQGFVAVFQDSAEENSNFTYELQ